MFGGINLIGAFGGLNYVEKLNAAYFSGLEALSVAVGGAFIGILEEWLLRRVSQQKGVTVASTLSIASFSAGALLGGLGYLLWSMGGIAIDRALLWGQTERSDRYGPANRRSAQAMSSHSQKVYWLNFRVSATYYPLVPQWDAHALRGAARRAQP